MGHTKKIIKKSLFFRVVSKYFVFSQRMSDRFAAQIDGNVSVEINSKNAKKKKNVFLIMATEVQFLPKCFSSNLI
jgi:hypothetical protein